MIYTITFNPSIDYMVSVDHFKLGTVNRTSQEYLLPGGKGINVSIVLHNLGIDSTALGFIAGFTGKEIENRVTNDFGVQCDFIDVENGYSRINFKLKSDEESEVNGNGPMINKEHIDKLYNKLSCLQAGDILILSGSIPKCLSDDIYSEIMEKLTDKNIEIVVDATGDLLMKVLKHKPFVIKPNNHELAEMFHVKLFGTQDIVKYAKKLQEMGAKNVLISMAGDGALFICENGKVYFSNAPKGQVKNSVGAGDSMVAGFVAGYEKTKDYVQAFRMGVATGSASAFSENLATASEVEKLLQEIKEVEYEY
ncbi:MAG: 1-phosphofructokinase [Longibaculum muris]|uniref:Tagatose-6-phosphate kinase n=1 Tax=Longibaculum muris TaxID=1796628 RepID=A0A4R3YPB7_9FIRM|nr:1-phosphofructokinase [Longibaculum muris]KXU49624.1 1-phosphofructokinase [Candidatus Stoquefichus sp. KLE1796]MBS5367871.1 1-phosphofructokinase [Coprobacillus cateniformis]MCR1889002.1 1-phosphofructokinase [Longibaculum muris]MED9812495.1 1-phosphofructokinase [Longibaculum muris]TCV94210.1 1-phosphofructokinase [Longibaculum muris]